MPGHEAHIALNDADRLEAVLRYHERTKHRFERYAAGPGRLDWVNQPDPFRRFDGAPLIKLPLLGPDATPFSPCYADLYRAASVPSALLTLASLSRLFEHALAITAWKQVGTTRWALRANPSSGNLHPTEGYALIAAVPGLGEAPGLYHYAAREHGLERRADCGGEGFAALLRGFPRHAFFVGLASIHWREAWKYGERAFRYCQHDAGHAIGALRLSAAALGWRAVLLNGLADATIEGLLGLNRDEDFVGAERENAQAMLVVWPADASESSPCTIPLQLDATLANDLTGRRWYGRANRLSRDDPVRWQAIDEVEHASRSPGGNCDPLQFATSPQVPRCDAEATTNGIAASKIVHQRRSLLACDASMSIRAESLYAMLTRVMPRVELDVARRPAPWDTLPWDATIHLGLFVHRVDGIDSGLYLLARDPAKIESLERAMDATFAWSVPPDCPADLPLRLLAAGDATRLATQVSCGQEIAGDGAFALAMLADFQDALVTHGPWFYRRLFWEAGLVGQVLYLEAEAAGVRATGIGCFFDEPVHQVFGLEGLTFQSLYHFTVGGPVDDPRLTTLPPYPSL